MILEDEVEDMAEMPESNLLLVDKDDVSGYVEFDRLDIRIRGDRLGGNAFTYEPNIPQFGRPKIFPGNSSRVQIDSSGPRGGGVHDPVVAELRREVLEEVDEDVSVGRGEGDWFPPSHIHCYQFSLNFPVL